MAIFDHLADEQDQFDGVSNMTHCLKNIWSFASGSWLYVWPSGTNVAETQICMSMILKQLRFNVFLGTSKKCISSSFYVVVGLQSSCGSGKVREILKFEKTISRSGNLKMQEKLSVTFGENKVAVLRPSWLIG